MGLTLHVTFNQNLLFKFDQLISLPLLNIIYC